ncbi:MerR family transcriptional regulator [bacterium]|nr:MerR family transcriptional regulator [bacterium]MBU1753966.1 MerR family transcriptional regulator [bacterium]
MTQVVIPDKLFFSISETSKLTGIKSYVLRYWESEFNVLKPDKTTGGQRRYRKKDIELLLKIKELLYVQGYTIAGAQRYLKKEKKASEEVAVANVIGLKNELKEMLKIIGHKE